MDFVLSADQEALRDGVQAFCAGRLSADRLRALEGTGFDRGLWSELAELGVFGLRSDGSGSGLAEAFLVFEALGRALAPGPILWSHLAAPFVPGAADGRVVVTGIDLPPTVDASAPPEAPGPAVVDHLAAADVLLVLRADGLFRLDARSVAGEASEKPLDPLTPVHRVAALPAGERLADAATAARLRLEGTVLTAALLLGIAQAALALATRHANERQQFDRPIGSFQAIKHLLADGYARQELARASVYAAGVLLDAPDGAAAPSAGAVAAAKLIAGEAAMKNARACIQVLGGMGFTWESPAHLFLKRTWVLESAFGTGARHAEALAEQVAAEA